jgi:hypothetical protein
MLLNPPAGGAADVQVVPLEVRIFPLAPEDVKPVPPTLAATVPVEIAEPLIPVVDAVVTTVPLVAGNVNTVVPALAGASSVTVPDTSPAITTELIV